MTYAGNAVYHNLSIPVTEGYRGTVKLGLKHFEVRTQAVELSDFLFLRACR